MKGDRCENDRKRALRQRRSTIRPCDRKRHSWAQRVLRVYGLTAEDVARRWEKQDGKCALCEEPLAGKRVWVIDHDHKTGKFRGLLHAWCNHRVLSMIERGGLKRARNAVKYLWG